MQATFESGGLSRREFMQGLMAAGCVTPGICTGPTTHWIRLS